MSRLPDDGESTLPVSAGRLKNDVCNRFELAWKRGKRPRIEDFINDVAPPNQKDLLRELVALEIDYRQLAGEKPSASEYRSRFPDLSSLAALKCTVNSSDSPSPTIDQSLPVVPGYELLKELGFGGMGIVYKAWQCSLKRTVALKMIRAGSRAEPEELTRFQLEAEAVSRLSHPHIVQVYEVGQAEGSPYLALEYVDGVSLAKQLAGTPLPARSAAQLAELLARAMQYAHQKGVVHRDLTPANILLAQTEPLEGLLLAGSRGERYFQPKITDFGLAKLFIGGERTITQSGAVLGTPSYMAPEQAGGWIKKIGPATDVYALGAILYECLTGRAPFKAETPLETLQQVLSNEPVSPGRLQPKLPRDLTIICLKCLEKDPSHRYSSAGYLAEDLRRFLAGEAIRARPVGSAERLWRLCKRYPLIAVLLTTVGLLILTIAIVSTISAARLNTALEKTRDAERQARLREAEALIGQAHGIRYSRRSGQRFEALAAIEKAATIGRGLQQPPEWFDRLRDEAIATLAAPDIQVTQTLDVFGPEIHGADLSPEWNLYIRANALGGCSVLRVGDDVEIARLADMGEKAGVWFGPRGFLVRYAENSTRLQLWDIRGPEPVCKVDRRQVEPVYNFRKDGKHIAFSYRDGSIAVHEMESGSEEFHLDPRGIANFSTPALHPTEPIVAVCSYYSRLLQIRDLKTGEMKSSLTLPWRRSSMCSWSPDGKILAVSAAEVDEDGDRTHLYAFDAPIQKLRLLQVLLGQSNGGTTIEFNPRGDRLATRGWNGKLHLFDVYTGRLLFVTSSQSFSLTSKLMHFDSTGKKIASARSGTQQEKIGLYSIADAREYRSIVHAGAGLNDQLEHGMGTFAIHPGGRLAAQSFKNGLVLFDLETGREYPFAKLPNMSGSVCFDGDGNLLSNSTAGLLRWPVRFDPARSERVVVGIPERLPFKPGNRQISTSRDGTVIAQAMYKGYGMVPYAGGWVGKNSDQPARLAAGESIVSSSVHPNGTLVAFGKHKSRVTVFDTASGHLVWQSPADNHDYCRFSSGGQWLISDSDGGRAYSTARWEPGPQLGTGIPWDVSPDSNLVVMGQLDGTYRLVEMATGKELARLEDPDQTVGAASFTPDGSRLVIAAQDGLRVWNLRRVRAELERLGLDWDAPPYPPEPASPSGKVPSPLTVEVGELLKND